MTVLGTPSWSRTDGFGGADEEDDDEEHEDDEEEEEDDEEDAKDGTIRGEIAAADDGDAADSDAADSATGLTTSS